VRSNPRVIGTDAINLLFPESRGCCPFANARTETNLFAHDRLQFERSTRFVRDHALHPGCQFSRSSTHAESDLEIILCDCY